MVFVPEGAVTCAQVKKITYPIMLISPYANNLSPMSNFLMTSVNKNKLIMDMMAIKGEGATNPSICLIVRRK